MKVRNRNLDPERIADFESFRSGILELIVKNAPLPSILNEIVLGIQTLNPSMVCTIVLIQNSKIKIGAAPTLPKEYNDAIEGATIGPEAGSCGTAAYTGKRVIVTDIDKSPLWKHYKEIALKVGLLSCWSEPIRSHDDTILGTFAIYHHEIASPDEFDIFIITETADLVSIAIEKSKTSMQLTESEKRFRDFFEKNSSMILIIDPESGEILDANESAVLFYGYPHKELTKMKIDRINHWDETEKEQKKISDYREGKSFLTFTHLLASGESKQVEVYSTPLESNHRQLLYCIIHDVTERKIAEEKVNALLLEKEMILREVHHRIKNNMTILSNLLQLQMVSNDNDAVKNSLKEATSRIKTMSILYDKLYAGKPVQEFSLKEYLEPLSTEIISLFPFPVQLQFVAEDFKLSPEKLQAIGIITNELLTNSLKYAKNNTNDLTISIRVSREGNHFHLEIRDNGSGFQIETTNTENQGFGINLVTMLTKQIKGDFSFFGGNGAEYKFKFPF
ncbi:PAS domain S-box protein [Leptospira yanagawae serovar Saopaulo str. Sao Paulo = ATCC 700523]|uniref:histidine kinase n=2 Tax=Leptospira yanagawae TaxID=293069 RepID=A0ABY2M0H7_9LEPT|nr:histidine kinase dimerization/phosphoacceptor domain -containing protein [Leptospira yanagawae]EOQ87321.1 PAS domain S-box protein [Leptospira yanagawae serovar Saopaulo str. Sao Paulo = ATCC 700523]TGL20108.1 PAS domain S-box protein [Leptospira yanagawae]